MFVAHIIQNHKINISDTSSVNCSVFPGLQWKSLTDNNLVNYFELLLLSKGEDRKLMSFYESTTCWAQKHS